MAVQSGQSPVSNELLVKLLNSPSKPVHHSDTLGHSILSFQENKRKFSPVHQ